MLLFKLATLEELATYSQTNETTATSEFEGGFSISDAIALQLVEDPWIPDLSASWWEL